MYRREPTNVPDLHALARSILARMGGNTSHSNVDGQPINTTMFGAHPDDYNGDPYLQLDQFPDEGFSYNQGGAAPYGFHAGASPMTGDVQFGAQANLPAGMTSATATIPHTAMLQRMFHNLFGGR